MGRSEPSHGCSTSVYEHPLPTTGPNPTLPLPKEPIENSSLHVRSPLPLLPIRYLSRYVESDANDFTGNHGNELYRRSAGVPQETHHRHGCSTPSMTGKNTGLIAALYVPFPLLFPLPFLLPFFLLPPILSSSLLSSLFLVTNTFHSACHEQSNQSPLRSIQSIPGWKTGASNGATSQLEWRSISSSPWCGFQHAPWAEGRGCGTGVRGTVEGDGGP